MRGGRYGDTALHKAVLFGHADMVDVLLDAVRVSCLASCILQPAS